MNIPSLIGGFLHCPNLFLESSYVCQALKWECHRNGNQQLRKAFSVDRHALPKSGLPGFKEDASVVLLGLSWMTSFEVFVQPFEVQTSLLTARKSVVTICRHDFYNAYSVSCAIELCPPLAWQRKCRMRTWDLGPYVFA